MPGGQGSHLRLPRSLGSRRTSLLYGRAVSGPIPERRLRLLPRIVEPGSRATGRLQHHVPSPERRRGRRRLRGLRRRVQEREQPPGGSRPGPRRLGLRVSRRRRTDLEDHVPPVEPPSPRRSQRAARASGEDPASLLPAVHRVASLSKRWLLGTHQGAVEDPHLPSYLDEFLAQSPPFHRGNVAVLRASKDPRVVGRGGAPPLPLGGCGLRIVIYVIRSHRTAVLP